MLRIKLALAISACDSAETNSCLPCCIRRENSLEDRGHRWLHNGESGFRTAFMRECLDGKKMQGKSERAMKTC